MYSFGIGHQHYKKVYLPATQTFNLDPDCPGPGNYATEYYNIGRHGKKPTFHQRQHDVTSPLSINIKNSNPGPGAYKPQIEINKFGKYNVSTLRNSLAANWSPSARFVDDLRHSKNFPGPGSYRDVDCMTQNSEMKFISSNFRSPESTRFKYPKKLKGSALNSSYNGTPGPGTYIPPSDFANTQKHFLKTEFTNTDFNSIKIKADDRSKLRSSTKTSFVRTKRKRQNTTAATASGTASATHTRVTTPPDGGFFSSKSMLDNSPYKSSNRSRVPFKETTQLRESRGEID